MILDLLIISIIVLMFYLGMKKGFVKEAFNLIKFMLIIYLVPKFTDIVISLFSLDEENVLNKYIIYICAFIFLYIALTIVIGILSKIMDVSILSLFNKLLGGVFGIIKASVIIFLIFIILLFISDKSENMKKILESSVSIEYISIYLGPYNKLFPEYISGKLDDFTMYNQEKQYKRSLLKSIEKRGLNE